MFFVFKYSKTMFRNTIIPVSFLFLAILVTSCFSKVTISVLEPGTYILPCLRSKSDNLFQTRDAGHSGFIRQPDGFAF